MAFHGKTAAKEMAEQIYFEEQFSVLGHHNLNISGAMISRIIPVTNIQGSHDLRLFLCVSIMNNWNSITSLNISSSSELALNLLVWTSKAIKGPTVYMS
jgi:hypothetical protein